MTKPQLVVYFSGVWGVLPLYVGVWATLDWDRVAAFISGAGFSVFVAVWFMVQHDRKLSELAAAIRGLQAVLELIYRLEHRPGGAGMVGRGKPGGEEG